MTTAEVRVCACGHIDAVHGGWARPGGGCGQEGCGCRFDRAADCEAKRYDSRPCSEQPAKFEVVYTSSKGAETDSHPACFVHALAEVDRHHASAGMSQCEMRPR